METALHLGLFAVAAAAVWIAGTKLSRDADALAAATGMGRVFIGALLLGVATSLPEIGAIVTAGVAGNPRLATGNLMGGVAAQMAVLAIADLFGSEERLTFHVSKPTVLLQHVLLLLLLSVAIAGMVAGEIVVVGGVGAWSLVVVLLYLAAVALVRGEEGRAAWELADNAPPAGRDAEVHAGDETPRHASSRPSVLRLGGLAL